VAHDVYSLQKRAFQELLRIRGAWSPIVFNGRTKKCIPGALWRNNEVQLVAALGKSRTTCDMLAEDFDKLGLIVSSQSVVLIDDLLMVVHAITRDDSDPCIHFTAVGDHVSSASAGPAVDEGSVALAVDQVTADLVFLNVDPAAPHVFTTLYVENLVDANPIGTFDPVPIIVVGNGRRIALGAAPDNGNYILRWRVRS
jgi:hypothetical protein